jgi:hypothetical protein
MLRSALRRYFATDIELSKLIQSAKKVIEVSSINQIALSRLNTFDEEYQSINEKMSSG